MYLLSLQLLQRLKTIAFFPPAAEGLAAAAGGAILPFRAAAFLPFGEPLGGTHAASGSVGDCCQDNLSKKSHKPQATVDFLWTYHTTAAVVDL